MTAFWHGTNHIHCVKLLDLPKLTLGNGPSHLQTQNLPRTVLFDAPRWCRGLF